MGMNPMAGSMNMGMGGMYSMGGINPADAAAAKKLVTLSRTDFLIQFVWQPLKPAEKPKDAAELQAKIADISTKMSTAAAAKKGAVVVIPKIEEAIEKASLQQSQEVANALKSATAPASTPPAAPGAPAAAPAPAIPAAPK